ncbi:helix-hairpin-helix domain-containing protein [Aerococcus sanguinicola]|uniref:helix-hairpin-helix domain-containing protein n=1 Tax=Aerococcus sanguinicola TaxID=119206 RepID=UPI0018A722A1|nr:helix-hairpin-helix domain-containing protein [Aerococcus sanguinicola]
MWNRWKNLSVQDIVHDYGRYLIGALVALCLALFFLGRFLGGNQSADLVEEVPVEALADQPEPVEPAPETAESSASPPPAQETLYVDVKGAVKEPKLYQVEAGMRVYDAVMLAGGFLPEADQDQVNFAQRLEDQMLVYIPRQGEEVPDTLKLAVQTGGSQAPASSGDQTPGNQVNLNTADSAELQTLSGVGEKKAADIIAYREANGPFQTVDDLAQVSGIGEKTLDKLRPQLTVD